MGRIVLVAAVCMTIILGCVSTSGVTLAEEDTTEVTFTVEDEDLQFSATLSVNIDWTNRVSLGEEDILTIFYEPSPASGSATIVIPLSWLYDYLYIDLDDIVFDIPLPDIPLGEYSLSLSESVTGIPSSIASADLVIQSAICAYSISCTSGADDILTDIDDLRWTSWCEKNLTVDMTGESEATVTTVFEYAISVGVVLTVFGDLLELELIPQTDIAGVTGSPSIQTEISSEQSSLSMYLVAALAIGIVSAVAAVALVLVRKKKAGKKE